MSVRAKFKVDVISLTKDGASVILSPVISGSKENDKFYKWTPSGKLELTTVNRSISDQLFPGQEVYIDITPADSATTKED